LADIALAGRVIASHYAEPLTRNIEIDTALRTAPSCEGRVLETVPAGEPFLMLDESLGWAWGYAGSNRRVGYLRSVSLEAQ
jgi:hypothetical protein